jgi:hypothetical protein
MKQRIRVQAFARMQQTVPLAFVLAAECLVQLDRGTARHLMREDAANPQFRSWEQNQAS